MHFDRLNPVILITGAAGAMGAACAQALAAHAQGGLILADDDEAALEAAADALAKPPERVSTLAFAQADQQRWADACAFIVAHYGRLDYAILNAGAAAPIDSRLWDPAQEGGADLESVALSLRMLAPLLGRNTQGGVAIIIAASDTIMDAPDEGLLAFVRLAAAEASGVSINALAVGAGRAAMARRAPLLENIARDAGDEAEALHRLSISPMPIARAPGDDPQRLIALFLANSGVGGVTLVVDASRAL